MTRRFIDVCFEAFYHSSSDLIVVRLGDRVVFGRCLRLPFLAVVITEPTYKSVHPTEPRSAVISIVTFAFRFNFGWLFSCQQLMTEHMETMQEQMTAMGDMMGPGGMMGQNQGGAAMDPNVASQMQTMGQHMNMMQQMMQQQQLMMNPTQ